MADLDAELAELEAELEKEEKIDNKKNEGNKSNNTNINKNYANNKPQPQPKKTNANNYTGYGKYAAGLEDFLNSNDTNTNSNNQKNYNYNNSNYNYQSNQKYNYNNPNNNYANNNKYNYNNNNSNNDYANSNNKYNNYNNYNNNSNKQSNHNYNNYNNTNNANNNYNNYYNNPPKNYAQNPYQNNNQKVSHTYKNPNQINQYQTQVRPKAQNQSNQIQSHNQPQNQPKIDQKNSSKTQVISKSKGPMDEPKEDIYPSKQENMYHKLKEMKSLTVLSEEIALCDKIIAFKKKRGLEYDTWETKKDLAEMQLNNTKDLIESGSIDFEAYKKLILAELAYEKKIMKFTESDKMSKPYELAEIKRRIEQRINVISKELTQNIDESETEPPKQEKKINNSSQKKEPTDSQKLTTKKSGEHNSKTSINPKKALEQNIPQDSNPTDKPKTQVYNNNAQPSNKIPMNQIPKQYIIQQKVLVTDPKTGKQMYVMKNVVDPKYEKALKQQALLAKQNQNKTAIDTNPHQHYIQQKVLVKDPKTGKQMYVMKNVVDPKYEKAMKQQALLSNQNQSKTTVDTNPQHYIQQKVLVTDPKTGKQMYVMKNVLDPKYAQQQKQPQNQIQTEQALNSNKTAVINSKNALKLQEQQEAQRKMREEIKKYQLYINTLIKEYTEAKEYFKRNGQEQLANKSRKDLQILYAAKQKVDVGRYKEVKLNTLPKTITPEYIYGYTSNERMEKFKAILSFYIKEKGDIDEKMKSIMEKMKKLRKKELEKAKEQVKPKLDEMKQRRDNYNKFIETLKEKFKDKWTPAPEYKKVMMEDKIEKVSYEGAIFGLKVKVGKTDYDKDKTFLKIYLQINKNKVLGKQVNLKQMGDYNEEWKWDFNGDEFKSIAKNFLYIELYRQHTFSDDKKGQGKIDLGRIRSGTKIKAECKIEIESKRVEPSIEFEITPIMPEGKKYYETIQKEGIQVTKIYPPFTGKQQVELPENKNTQDLNQPKTMVVQKNNNIPNNNNNNNNAQNTNNNNNQPKIDKSKFKPEELEDVDFIDNLNTLKVLDFKIKELEAKIKKIDGRTPKELLQKKVKMNCKKKLIMEQMGDGSISPKDYLELLKAQLEHDQLLALYMKQNNQIDKEKIILQRMPLIKEEISELIKTVC